MQGTYTILEGNIPRYSSAQWSIVNGTGGSFENDTAPETKFYGQINETYTLVWSFTTPCMSTFDTVKISFAPFTCGDSLLDVRDGKKYATIHIGDQCWMQDNLNVGTMVSGAHSFNTLLEKSCYDNSEMNCDIYGGVYDWNEMMKYNPSNPQGICPVGWHVPTDEQWKTLEGFADSYYPIGDAQWNNTGDRGFDAGGHLKDTGLIYWTAPNFGATNITEFTSLPSGYRNPSNGYYYNKGTIGYYWTSTQYNGSSSWMRSHSNNTVWTYRSYNSNTHRFSLRCIKDLSLIHI
jgi:uncharacterized protein (TIGR02145 family)